MNDKKAKALRRAAHARTAGLPERAYRRQVHRDAKGRSIPGAIVLTNCERGIYRRLKREATR